MKNYVIVASVILAGVMSTVMGDFEDNFDAGSRDPAWSEVVVSDCNATNLHIDMMVSYAGLMQVDGMDGVDSGDNVIRMERADTLSGDFTAYMWITGSEISDGRSTSVYLELWDASDNVLAKVGFSDQYAYNKWAGDLWEVDGSGYDTWEVYTSDIYNIHYRIHRIGDQYTLTKQIGTGSDIIGYETLYTATGSTADVAKVAVVYDYLYSLTWPSTWFGGPHNLLHVETGPFDCAEWVKETDSAMLADLNSDCHVTMLDFAMLAADWLKCNDPSDPVNCP